MSAADPRVTAARAFLAAAKQRKFADKPQTVLVREAAELRHQLGQLLKVIDEPGEPGWAACGVAGILCPADVQTVLSALGAAAENGVSCPDCDATPEDPCGPCTERLRLADEYDQLAARLGGES